VDPFISSQLGSWQVRPRLAGLLTSFLSNSVFPSSPHTLGYNDYLFLYYVPWERATPMMACGRRLLRDRFEPPHSILLLFVTSLPFSRRYSIKLMSIPAMKNFRSLRQRSDFSFPPLVFFFCPRLFTSPKLTSLFFSLLRHSFFEDTDS